jgi:hypothetical protein
MSTHALGRSPAPVSKELFIPAGYCTVLKFWRERCWCTLPIRFMIFNGTPVATIWCVIPYLWPTLLINPLSSWQLHFTRLPLMALLLLLAHLITKQMVPVVNNCHGLRKRRHCHFANLDKLLCDLFHGHWIMSVATCQVAVPSMSSADSKSSNAYVWTSCVI